MGCSHFQLPVRQLQTKRLQIPACVEAARCELESFDSQGPASTVCVANGSPSEAGRAVAPGHGSQSRETPAPTSAARGLSLQHDARAPALWLFQDQNNKLQNNGGFILKRSLDV